ncbi:MAG: pseudouridine synthase [Candidatus Bathyarchaeota archaeon]|nr:pseudouridine synthase [Candidatus Bathyarchaeota archaeon]
MNKDLERLRGIADYQFGYGAGSVLFPDDTRIEYSKNTSRPRHIYDDDVMVANYRPTDAVFTITIAGAERLNGLDGFTGYVVVMDEVLEFIENGKNLFAKHVVEAGPGIRPDDELIVRDTKGDVVAVGKAVLTSDEMLRFKNGQAVDVRRGRKRHK